MTVKFQSTLPAWGATEDVKAIAAAIGISIHAPRMGSDIFSRIISLQYRKFQSTLPAWGATNSSTDASVIRIISIHAPRMGSDKFYAHH